MSDKKPSTEDILAKIRGGGAKPSSEKPATAKPEEAGESAEAAEAPAAATPPAQPATTAPTGTSDILAAVRSGGVAKGKPASAGAETPKSTADILASVKSGGAGAAPKPGAAAPSATSDILASLRAGKSGGAAAGGPAAAKAAPKAAAKPKVDASAASGMSAAEMIRAAREGKTRPAAAGQPQPGKVALPKKPLTKPAAAPVKPTAVENRRTVLAYLLGVVTSPIILAWTSMVAAATASTLAMARFMMPNVLVEPPTQFKIGPPTDYGPGTVSTKWKAQFGVWIVNAEVDGGQMIYALSTVCTHLGCTPNWLEGEQKFKCPCHGSGFYISGVNFEGPAPRPLERMGIRLAEDGMLEVDKSVKFQKELGQWENAASFVPVA